MQQKIMYKNESELENIVLNSLENRYGLKCKRQVKINGRIPDIIAYDDDTDSLFGIEIKLRDWKKGLFQSFLYKNFVDYSFLCMPLNFFNTIETKIQDDLNKVGVGFIEIDCKNNKIHFKQKAKKNKVEKTRRENIKKIVLQIE